MSSSSAKGLSRIPLLYFVYFLRLFLLVWCLFHFRLKNIKIYFVSWIQFAWPQDIVFLLPIYFLPGVRKGFQVCILHVEREWCAAEFPLSLCPRWLRCGILLDIHIRAFRNIQELSCLSFLYLSSAYDLPLFCCHVIFYRVIHKSLRDFRTRLRNNQDRHGRKEHIIRQRISPSIFCARGLGVLPGSTATGQS